MPTGDTAHAILARVSVVQIYMSLTGHKSRPTRLLRRRAGVLGSQSLQIVGQPLDLSMEGLPLEQECANHLRRAPGPQAFDLAAENVPVACGRAQYRIQSLVQLLKGREEVCVEFVDATAAQHYSG